MWRWELQLADSYGEARCLFVDANGGRLGLAQSRFELKIREDVFTTALCDVMAANPTVTGGARRSRAPRLGTLAGRDNNDSKVIRRRFDTFGTRRAKTDQIQHS